MIQRCSCVVLFALLLLAGCNTANRMTVARITTLPPLTTAQDAKQQSQSPESPPPRNPNRRGHRVRTATPTPISVTGRGTAIHLDAQQRLVLATAMGFCAEPSPDALAAYTSSLGLGIRASNLSAASVARTLATSAGSIGLRTQSITLMRDALYRMCEASNNGHLANWEIAAFLRRSQDLTAVVLAIEQLTGATAANQIGVFRRICGQNGKDS